MKRAWILFAAAAVLLAAPAVKRASLAAMEKSFDQRVRQIAPEDRNVLVGFARGLYLENYGAVFTAEVNLATGSRPSPFMPVVPPAEIARIHKLKRDRLPLLRQSMRDMLTSAAASLDDVPAKEQIVVGVSLLSFSDEDTTGLPAQILMQGERGKLIDAKLGRVSLDSVIKVQDLN